MDPASAYLAFLLTNLNGATSWAFLCAIIATIPLSFLVIWRYRRSVLKAMNVSAGGPPAPSEPQLQTDDAGAHGSPESGRNALENAPRRKHGADRRYALRAPWIAAALYALAGVVYAIAATVLYFWATGIEFLPVRTMMVVLVLAWPAVLAALYVGTPSWLGRLLGIAAYICLLGALSFTIGANLVLLLWTFSGFATIALAVLSNDRLKTVGPFILVILIFATTASLFSVVLAWRVLDKQFVSSAGQATLVGLVVTLLIGAVVGWFVLRRVATSYQNKHMSDQMLMVSVWVLLFAFWLSLFLVNPLGPWGIAGLFAFVAFAAALRWILVPLEWRARRRANSRLLLLRVFASDGGKETLFRKLTHYWRYLGSIELIGAPDLATATLEPQELMTYLSGGLEQRFIGSTADLESRIESGDRKPDRDGRYRINEYYCHDNAWRETVMRLVRETQVTLVDLRGFRAENQGVGYELKLLIDVLPVSRFLLVVDRTTDRGALDTLLKELWRTMNSDSPNQGRAFSISQFDEGNGDMKNIRSLVAELCAALEN